MAVENIIGCDHGNSICQVIVSEKNGIYLSLPYVIGEVARSAGGVTFQLLPLCRYATSRLMLLLLPTSCIHAVASAQGKLNRATFIYEITNAPQSSPSTSLSNSAQKTLYHPTDLCPLHVYLFGI